MRCLRFLILATGLLLLGAAAELHAQKGGLPGEKFTPPARGERLPDKLKVGDAAPDFTLPDTAGKTGPALSSFKGKKPVVLIFGSCT